MILKFVKQPLSLMLLEDFQNKVTALATTALSWDTFIWNKTVHSLQTFA